MEIIDSSTEHVTVRLSAGEAVIINNALNELCNGYNMSDRELELRSGFTRDQIRTVLQTLHDAIPPEGI
ncbi:MULTISPECIES: hypothetical protein [unclassified Streptomyces]|uniref:hypothetical protein n=1 Tax=unclassified Streptomyces TaxID=2593676 RepID=UPI00131B371F|nr:MULTISPECIES: hypothetical protein [unclassified Streptomyces]